VKGSNDRLLQPAAFAAVFAGETMQIIINGEQRSVAEQSVLHLLQSLEIDPRRVAVELNMEILPKAEYETTTLADGDRIEIVHFVGGG
jgi:sulfur carrier protein